MLCSMAGWDLGALQPRGCLRAATYWAWEFQTRTCLLHTSMHLMPQDSFAGPVPSKTVFGQGSAVVPLWGSARDVWEDAAGCGAHALATTLTLASASIEVLTICMPSQYQGFCGGSNPPSLGDPLSPLFIEVGKCSHHRPPGASAPHLCGAQVVPMHQQCACAGPAVQDSRY